jgi:probable F420-dependent oxidoreductase
MTDNPIKTLEHPGKLGVWASLDTMTADEAVAFCQKIEQLGYSALWLPEAVGRDPFSLIGFLGGQTEKLIFATGIANIYARDAVLIHSIHKTLAALLPGRFILGLGVSHPHLVENVRGHEWQKPVAKMRAILDALPEALFMARAPEIEAPIVIAALRPLMLKLAGEKARGAHPYLVTPEHTKRAREILGQGPWLCPEQMVILDTDAENARKIAREHLKVYLRAPNYQRSLAELGFSADDYDWKTGGSDRLVDELVAWGDAERIGAHLKRHWDNGADHVCIQAFRPDGQHGPDMAALEALVAS